MPDDIVFEVIDAASGQARWAMEQYFDELDRRFSTGFDASDAFDEAALDFNEPNGLFVVAVDDGTTIGCGAILLLDQTSAEIKRMWVDSTRRGIGLGKRLLGHLEAEVRHFGRTRVILDTNEVLTEAISMYRHLGYTAIERYNDNPYAHHWFEKHLPPPTPP